MPEIVENIAPIDTTAGLLESYGIKPTRQRLDIARVLFARHQHLSADQVMAMKFTFPWNRAFEVQVDYEA